VLSAGRNKLPGTSHLTKVAVIVPAPLTVALVLDSDGFAITISGLLVDHELNLNPELAVAEIAIVLPALNHVDTDGFTDPPFEGADANDTKN